MPESPFEEGPLDEVPLFPAPLETVIVQIRFPEVMSLAKPDFVAPFQEAVRGNYPILRRMQQPKPRQVSPTELQLATVTTWEFRDTSETWVIGLGPESVSLTTTAYESRSDLLGRLASVLEALDALTSPPLIAVYDRVGVRYINRLTGPDLVNLKTLVEPAMVGPSAIEMPPGKSIKQTISVAEYQLEESSMQVRWGMVPTGASMAPGMKALEEPSWVLDLDVYYDMQAPYERTEVLKMVGAAANRVYHYFRWAMTDDFVNARKAQR